MTSHDRMTPMASPGAARVASATVASATIASAITAHVSSTTTTGNAATGATPPMPWWRFGIMWFTLGLPASVVVASLGSAVIAWRHIDPVVTDSLPSMSRAAEDAAQPGHAAGALEPAERARNHAATPAR